MKRVAYNQVVILGLTIALCIVGIITPAHAAKKNKSKKSDSVTQTLIVQNGDTFSTLMEEAHISLRDSLNVQRALRSSFDVASLKIGQKVEVTISPAAGGNNVFRLDRLSLKTEKKKRLELLRKGDKTFEVREFIPPTTVKLAKASGNVDFTFYGAVAKAGVPNNIRDKLIKNYSYDVDFQRDIRKGTPFEVLYEQLVDSDGEVVGSGEIVYSSLKIRGNEYAFYRYETLYGDVGYFDAEGQSIEKSFLRTPVDGAQITSTFGERRHPILGYTRQHKGLDFGAPSGTPIYAAASGVIVNMESKGSYGNYVRLHHRNGYETAYAHLSRFNTDLKRGRAVKQGDVIGYVGTTGQSTGPHLHYELLANGRQINPLSIKTVATTQLKGLELGIFKQYQNQVMQVADKLDAKNRLASRE